MVLPLSIGCREKICVYPETENTVLIFEARLQGSIYVKVPGREMSEFLSEFTVTFILIEVMQVLGQ